jgi:hypothetical protein
VRVRLVIATSAAIATTLGAVAVPVIGASTSRIVATPSSATAGTVLAVQGSGFTKGSRGTIALDGAGGISFRSSGNGTFSLSFTIPGTTSVGGHTLAALSTRGATLAATPVQVVAAAARFVTVCGTGLCVGDQRWYLFGASQYGGYADPDGVARMAVSAHLNTLRLGNFLDEQGDPATAPYDAARWATLDTAIAAAARNGLRVILDLSSYRNLLRNAGLDPYAQDWASFITFAAERRNSVSGVRYADDPTIALVSLAGEVEPINSPDNRLGITTQEVTDFFARSLAEWRSHDANHLLSSGGLAQLDWDSGIDWRSIDALAVDQVCSIHDYSAGDQTITTPAVASFCAGLGKPWITEEFGWPQAVGDATRAADFSAMYSLQRTYSAAGVGFWNLGNELLGAGGVTETFDVNASTPATWSAVIANAP